MPLVLPQYRAILCDLDGCLVSGETVLPGAAEFVAATSDRLVVLSNNSTDTTASLSDRLARGGLVVPPGRIALAGVAALDVVARRQPCARVWVCGSGATVDHALQLGLISDEIAPEVVILTRDTGFTYQRLQQILGYLTRGAQLIAANGDATHPGADGVPVPETGALLAAIRTCLPDQPVEVIGKPQQGLFFSALERLGANPGEAVMIGDNPETDGEGARSAGIDFIQIGALAGSRFRDLAGLIAARETLS